MPVSLKHEFWQYYTSFSSFLPSKMSTPQKKQFKCNSNSHRKQSIIPGGDVSSQPALNLCFLFYNPVLATKPWQEWPILSFDHKLFF